jgi:RHS repeat-associated protein
VRVSVASGGAQANGASKGTLGMSADGRFVTFTSAATNLVPGDTNGRDDVFVHDRDADADGVYDEAGATTTVLVSRTTAGVQGDDTSQMSAISADGRFVVFDTWGANFVTGDDNRRRDVVLHDRDADGDGVYDEAGQVASTVVSRTAGGRTGGGESGWADISADGTQVVFVSAARDLVADPADTGSGHNLYAYDVAAASIGLLATGDLAFPNVSADGRLVSAEDVVVSVGGFLRGQAFVVDRDADANGVFDDTTPTALALAPRRPAGHAGDLVSRAAQFAADGTYVFATTDALVAGDANGVDDVYVATPGRARRRYHYDAADRLVGFAGEGRVATYAYDGDGTRVVRSVDGRTTAVAWDRSGALPLVLADGTNHYVYGPGGMALAQIGPDDDVTVFHHDQGGSARVLTDTLGAVVGTRTYDPWGAPVATTGAFDTPVGFAGEHTDAESGLVHLRARYYDPATAQFLTRDPIEMLTRDAYGYAGNDPINKVDPTGLAGFTIGPVKVGDLGDAAYEVQGFLGRNVVRPLVGVGIVGFTFTVGSNIGFFVGGAACGVGPWGIPCALAGGAIGGGAGTWAGVKVVAWVDGWLQRVPGWC